ncbi:MAG TPA: DUF4112 domain-containing protein [Pseudomonadales bacterium]
MAIPRPADRRPTVAQHHDVQRLATWLDDAFTIPGTRFRVGWDSIVGLVPGAGDLLTTLPALWIVMRALDLGVPKVVAARMVLNILIDNLIGAIPILGDLFDAVWKANRRNVELLDRYYRDPQITRRRSTASLAGTLLVLAAVAVVVVVVPILVLVWLVRALGAGSA